MSAEIFVLGFFIGIGLTILWRHRHASPSFAPNDYGEAPAPRVAGEVFTWKRVGDRYIPSEPPAPEDAMLRASNRRRFA